MKSTIPQNKEQVKNNLVRVLSTLPSHKIKPRICGVLFLLLMRGNETHAVGSVKAKSERRRRRSEGRTK